MTIYLSTAIRAQYLPYTYRIGWSPAQTGLDYWVYYYGCKYAKDAHPDLFWVDYWTSSEYVTEKRKEWGEPELKEIRKIWQGLPYDVMAARKVTKYESRVLTWLKAATRIDYLNQHNGHENWNTAGLSPAKCAKTGKSLGVLPITDPRWDTKEIIHPLGGRITVRDSSGNTKSVPNNDPQWLNGELVSVLTGRMTAKDKDGNTFQTDVNDPRRLTGEITGNRAGLIPIKGGSVAKDDPRWVNGEVSHPLKGRITVVDKDGNTESVTVDDPRYLNGSLKGIATGRVAAFDANGNSLGLKPTDDPRWKSEEWRTAGTNRVVVIDKDGKTKSISCDDPEWLSGEVSHVNTKKQAVKDRYGRRFSVTQEDPRWSTGEIAGVAKKEWQLYQCCLSAVLTDK